MKITLRVLIIALIVCFSSFKGFAQASFAFHPIISEGLQVSEEIEVQHPDIEILMMTFDIANNHNFTFIDLEEGSDYVFACFADPTVADVSLILNQEKRGEMSEITSSSEFKNKATLRVTADKSDRYVINVRVNEFKSTEQDSHYGLIVCRLPHNH